MPLLRNLVGFVGTGNTRQARLPVVPRPTSQLVVRVDPGTIAPPPPPHSMPPLSGVGAIGTVGSINATANKTFAITGISGSGSVVGVVQSRALTLAGTAATGAVGTVTPKRAITGVSGTGAVVVCGVTHTVSIGGVGATGSVGDIAGTAGIDTITGLDVYTLDGKRVLASATF